MNLLEVRGIVAGYGGMEILHEVCLDLQVGEIIAIIGPNGAGKSTLMKAIFGLLKIQSGQIVLKGEEITHLSPDRLVHLGLSYVPQVENIFPSLTAEENLEMGAFILSEDLTARKEKIYQLFPPLRELRGRRVGKMSGGQRQMVAMGRALMLDPQVLILDEPSAGLSPKLVGGIFERILEINRTGVSIIMVEQNAKQSLKLAHRGYVLASGRNRFTGTGKELLDNPEVGRLYLGG